MVFETRSRLSGRIRVVDRGAERRLVVDGETQSVYPRDGDWRRAHRDYWWHALTAAPIPPRPTALLVGLGGGTQVHLLRTLAAPRSITIIERDPTIVRVATDWFGLDGAGGLEILCLDAHRALVALARACRRFDYVMEDVAYAEAAEQSLPLALACANLVSPRGLLVVNRHRRGDAGRLATALTARFTAVWLRRVRREGENVLVCATGPRPATAAPARSPA